MATLPAFRIAGTRHRCASPSEPPGVTRRAADALKQVHGPRVAWLCGALSGCTQVARRTSSFSSPTPLYSSSASRGIISSGIAVLPVYLAPHSEAPSEYPSRREACSRFQSESGLMNAGDFCSPPPRDEALYGPKARQNGAKCSQLARDFFQAGVKRARVQNQRSAWSVTVVLT